MTVNRSEPNKMEITVGDYKVFVSYQTPVACIDLRNGQAYRTTTTHSKTTSKHIAQWLRGRTFIACPQAMFDDLLTTKP